MSEYYITYSAVTVEPKPVFQHCAPNGRDVESSMPHVYKTASEKLHRAGMTPRLVGNPMPTTVSALRSLVRSVYSPANGYPSHIVYAGLQTLTNSISLERLDDVKDSEVTRAARIPYKEFRERQEQGEILVSPMRAVDNVFRDRVMPRMGEVPLLDTGNNTNFAVIQMDSDANPERVALCAIGSKYWYHDGTEYVRDSVMIDNDTFCGRQLASAQLYKGEQLTTVFQEYGYPWPADIRRQVFDQRISPNLTREAQAKLNQGILDVLTELAELPETIQYIYGLLRSMVNLYLSFKKKEGDLKKRMRTIGAAAHEVTSQVSSLWLQFRYAAMPIVYSVESLIELAQGQPHFLTVRTRQDLPVTLTSNGWSADVVLQERVWGKARVSGSLSGLGINVPKTLWELQPLSFVVDWALPIGELLGAIGQPTGAEQVVFTRSIQIRDDNVVFRHNQSGQEISCSLNMYDVREINPHHHMGLGISPNMNFKRYIDAAALAWNLFLKQRWRSRK